MQTSLSRLGKLPAETRAKLRSTQTLTSLPQLVSELLQNALDAGARHIDVGVDCEEWTCWVRDDGCGISKEGLNMIGLGADGGRYGTSKQYASGSMNAQSTFGFRGEALASAADLSCLEVCSRNVNSRSTWSVIVKGGQNLYTGPAVRWKREAPGTVVCIRDAFYNLPIRRKTHPPASRTFELIRNGIETFALVFPEVSFSLENTSETGRPNTLKDRVFRIPKTASSLDTFRLIFGRALTEHIQPISECSIDAKIEGFISLSGTQSKSYQYLYLNRHPIAHGELHRVIDSKFALSTFSKNALDESGETTLPRTTIRRSPRKAEKKPVYVLNLTLPPEQIDNLLEPAKSNVHFQDKQSVMSFLSSVIQRFLVQHRFSTREDTPPVLDDFTSSPRKKRKLEMERNALSADDDQIEPLKPFVLEINTTPLYTSNHFDSNEQDRVAWRDPATGETFIIDQRTGHTFPRSAGPHETEDHSCNVFGQQSSRRTISYRRPDESRDNAVPDWLERALKANNTYTRAELEVPSIPGTPDTPYITNTQNRHFQKENEVCRYKKEDLRHARVINQVDRKFIACVIRLENVPRSASVPDEISKTRSLVLVDQHAADERIRVERFLRELCLGFLYSRAGGTDSTKRICVKDLSPPVPLLLTHHEAAKLQTSAELRQAFSLWGFHFVDPSEEESQATDSSSESDSYVQLHVRGIPDVVSAKLLSGDELRDLVKGYLSQLETDLPLMGRESSLVEQPEEFAWLKALRWCPRDLLALVNSKACRGAIMFNDPLTRSQCQRLVRQLSETAFPFQCAHGRPSLVPIADVQSPTEDVSRQKRSTNRRLDWSNLEN